MEKLWKMWENVERLNSSQQKEEKNHLIPQTNFHTTKFFTEKLLVIGMKKTEILMNKPVYLGLPLKN